MKLSLIVISFLLSLIFLYQAYATVHTTASVIDSAGNTYILVNCLGNFTIGGQNYSITIPSAFLLKLDADGQVTQTKIITSTQSIKANSIDIDEFGNIYIIGEFAGTAVFDSHTLTSQGTDIYIVKYTPDWNAVWVKHGLCSNTAKGNDIFVSNGLVYTCGTGGPVTFDALSIDTKGFAAIFNTEGTTIKLLQGYTEAKDISADNIGNVFLLIRYLTGYPYYLEYQALMKYNSMGGLLWNKIIFWGQSTTDKDMLTYISGGLVKLDANGNTLKFKNDQSYCQDIKITSDHNILIAGSYTTEDPSIYNLPNSGLSDAYIAKTDTGYGLLWAKHCGGIFKDSFNSVNEYSNGDILATGNFNGTINIDTLYLTGSGGLDDNWIAATKFDEDGNVIWLRKIAENFSPPDTTDWFPLEVGNKFQYYSKSYYWPQTFGAANIKLFQVTDSVWINNKKYYSVEGFFKFNHGTRIRYDEETQRIMVLYQIEEYPFMDFSKVEGEVFQQIQKDGSFLNTTIIADTLVVFEDTISVKGFYNSVREFGPPPITWYVNSWNFFAPEIGWVIRDEECSNPGGPTDLFLIEHLIFKEEQRIHKKHIETATVIF